MHATTHPKRGAWHVVPVSRGRVIPMVSSSSSRPLFDVVARFASPFRRSCRFDQTCRSVPSASPVGRALRSRNEKGSDAVRAEIMERGGEGQPQNRGNVAAPTSGEIIFQSRRRGAKGLRGQVAGESAFARCFPPVGAGSGKTPGDGRLTRRGRGRASLTRRARRRGVRGRCEGGRAGMAGKFPAPGGKKRNTGIPMTHAWR